MLFVRSRTPLMAACPALDLVVACCDPPLLRVTNCMCCLSCRVKRFNGECFAHKGLYARDFMCVSVCVRVFFVGKRRRRYRDKLVAKEAQEATQALASYADHVTCLRADFCLSMLASLPCDRYGGLCETACGLGPARNKIHPLTSLLTVFWYRRLTLQTAPKDRQ